MWNDYLLAERPLRQQDAVTIRTTFCLEKATSVNIFDEGRDRSRVFMAYQGILTTLAIILVQSIFENTIHTSANRSGTRIRPLYDSLIKPVAILQAISNEANAGGLILYYLVAFVFSSLCLSRLYNCILCPYVQYS